MKEKFKAFNFKNTTFLKFIEKLLSVILLLLSVFIINKFYGGKGGVENSTALLVLEVPLIIIIYFFILYFLKNRLLSYLLAGIPIILFYIFFNEFYFYFNRVLRFSDISQIPELIKFANFYSLLICAVFAAIYVYLYIKKLDNKRSRCPYFPIIVFILFFYLIKFNPSLYITINEYFGFKENILKQKQNAQNRGILNYTLFVEAKKNLAFKNLKEEPLSNEVKELKLNKNFANIHLVVLESFYDPNMFSNLSFSKNPIWPQFSAKFNFTENYSLSPVYAGGSPQAEFELLTGVPAFQEFSAVEFNLFTGKHIDGFVNNLNKVGYHTIVMNATSPEIFNSYNAYKSIGFDQQHYLYGKKYSNKTQRYELIFDGDLFKHNLHILDSIKKSKPSVPIFNYVLGIYGHTPFLMDTLKHPQVIDVEYKGKKVSNYESNSINQIYYRTKALNSYIESLSELDPNSLIVIIGDHMPNMSNIRKYGLTDQYKMKFYIIKNGKSININKTIHHYEIPGLIINLLSGQEINYSEEDLRKMYRRMFFQTLN